MPINFGLLNTPQQPNIQTQMVQTAPQDSGIGDIMQGAQGLLGKIFGKNPVSQANAAVSTSMDNTPIHQIASSVMPQQAQQSPIPQSLQQPIQQPKALQPQTSSASASSSPPSISLSNPQQGQTGLLDPMSKYVFGNSPQTSNNPTASPLLSAPGGSPTNSPIGPASSPLSLNGQDTSNSKNMANMMQLSNERSQNASDAAHSGDAYKVAQGFLGDGRQAHADVLEGFFQKAGMGRVNIQNTPWCAGFANSVLMTTGHGGTGSLAARSFLNYGTPTKEPSQGDVVVFKDLTGANNPAHGHVGFYAGEGDKPGMIKVLGGNQSGAVSIKQYPASKVIGYRIPPSAEEIQAKQKKMAYNP